MLINLTNKGKRKRTGTAASAEQAKANDEKGGRVKKRVSMGKAQRSGRSDQGATKE